MPRKLPLEMYAAGEEIFGARVAMALMEMRGAATKIEGPPEAPLRIVNSHVRLPGINIWCATLSDRLTLRFEDADDQLRIYFPSQTIARIHTATGVLVRDETKAVVCWTRDMRRGDFEAGYGGPAMSLSRACLRKRLAERIEGPLTSELSFEAETPSDRAGVKELCSFVSRLLERDSVEILSRSIDASESMSKVILDMVLDIFPSNYSRFWSGDVQNSTYPYYIRRCLNLMEGLEGLAAVNVETLARHAGVSKRTLQYGFQHFFGCTPHAYLRRERLLRAKKAILESECSLAEIAKRQGYSNLARFSRDFEAHLGVRPSALRQSRPSGGAR